MISNLLRVTLLILLPLSAVPAQSANPFNDQDFLLKQLATLSNDDSVLVPITDDPKNQSWSYDSSMKKVASYDDVQTVLYALNILQFEMLPAEDGLSFVDGLHVNARSIWTIPSKLTWLRDEVQKSGDQVILPLGLRTVEPSSLKFDEWSEGNSDFAIVRGTYEYANYLSQSKLPAIPFSLIVEKHPASNGWFLSQYKGNSSTVSTVGEDTLKSVIADLVLAEKMNVTSKREDALKKANIDLRAKKFPKYKTKDHILQVGWTKPNGDEVVELIYQDPQFGMSYDESLAYCKNLNANGFKNWVLPGQYEIAALLNGGDFEEWMEKRRVSDSPDGYFWHPLNEGARKTRAGYGQLWTSDTRVVNGNKDYFMVFLYPSDDGQMRASGQSDFVSYGVHPGLMTICTNSDTSDTNAFSKLDGVE